MVARTAGGREVAGSNPVTPIPWQGHGRRSDPSGGLRKRETVYCGVSFLCNRKLRSYYTKTFRGDVQLAVRYIMLCIPLGRKCAASAHFVFRKKERHRKTRQNQFMILPGFVTAETAGFEPACRLPDNLISSQARYGHFDTFPYYYNNLPCVLERVIATKAPR